jgi:thiosulfate dehydrogenase (quinone) large subunit
MRKNLKSRYTFSRLIPLVALRVALGWNFMYEGISKLLQEDWTSYSFLMNSQGWFPELFRSIARNPVALAVTDQVNMWGFTLIGFALIAGIFTRYALIGGMILLLFYYFAQPPLTVPEYMLAGEETFLWANKTLIELLALVVLVVYPTGHIIGIDRLFNKSK